MIHLKQAKEGAACTKKTSIGGQALIEGIMMRGPQKSAMAVRNTKGEIVVEEFETKGAKRPKICKLPIIRGILAYIDSMTIGYKCLMRSAELSGLEEVEEEDGTTQKIPKWLMTLVTIFSTLLGFAIAIGLFVWLPAQLYDWTLSRAVTTENAALASLIKSVFEGVLKVLLLVGYMAAISLMKDIRRTFMYHGAEHKTIACYEAGEELTCENVKKFTRFHPRCGTSFLLFVMIVSIILYALLPKFSGDEYSALQRLFFRMGTRLLLLPFVAGISYEIIKFAGRSKNVCVKWLTKPGLWLQRLTTREPDSAQIETAITSLTAVIPEVEGADKW